MARNFTDCKSLDRFPVVKNGRVWYPLRGYEFVRPSRGGRLVQKRDGKHTCWVRRKESGRFLRVHPRAYTPGGLHYWRVCVRVSGDSVHLSHARIAAFSLLAPRRKMAESVVHHYHKQKLLWNGKRIDVCRENTSRDFVWMSRAEHQALHA